MAFTICFYEDDCLNNFYPLTYLRPVYLLRAGMAELFRRHNPLNDDSRVILTCRESLAQIVSKNYDFPVNIIKRDESHVLFVNGRLKDWGDLASTLKQTNISTQFVTSKGETVAVLFRKELQGSLPPMITPKDFQYLYEKDCDMIPVTTTTASMYNYCWELVADLHEALTSDF